MIEQLKKYPPFLLAMAGLTLLYPIAVVAGTVLFSAITIWNAHPAGNMIVLKSSMEAVSRSEVVIGSFFSLMFLGLCPYTIAMIFAGVLHFATQHAKANTSP